jgi:DNA-binding NarL/FixJ family response regulator
MSALPEHTPHAPQAPPLTCFIVEDSPVIRQNLIATLEELLPVRVVGTAEDEQAALVWMQAPGACCDLMVIDIFLKTGTGLEVLRRAAALCPGARRVVLTNYATPDMRRRCTQLGADRVFDKSAELEELLAYCAALADAPRPQ